jgi:energy-coupling factor transporter ATP-binding protein EcfA2
LRIRRVVIRQWRNFENIELQLDEAAALVCVVGANGTGKSHLLELIAACAHHLGLSPSIPKSRGNPFSDPHDFELQFFLATGVSEAVEGLANEAAFVNWDRTLTLRTRDNLPGEEVRRLSAGGIDEHQSVQFAERVVARLGQAKEVNFVSLDADRAYPNRSFAIHEIAQAYEIDWDAPD